MQSIMRAGHASGFQERSFGRIILAWHGGRVLVASLSLLLALSACVIPPVPPPTPAPSLVAQVTASLLPPDPQPSPTPLPSQTSSSLQAEPTQLPLVGVEPCWQVGGRVERGTLPVDSLPQPLQYRVYLPPCYDQLPQQRYPVLYLLHGQGYTDDQWERLGAPQVVDQLSALGELSPFLIVMPRDRVWSEPDEDGFGRAMVEALLPHIDAVYRSLPERQYRAIGGLSRGAAWALHLGLSEWKTFGAIGMHSGFVFQSDTKQVMGWLESIPLEQMPRIYMDLSDNEQDIIEQSAIWFEQQLTQAGIAHEWYLYPGFHNEDYWQAHVEQYLRWYAQAWE